jgi:hydroxyethylthiazole kinase-like uncharacterized protein yjeF
MKIFNAQQIYDADKWTIQRQGISSDALMERAAVQLFNWIHSRLQGGGTPLYIFCGIGNNGGDGIALARHLVEHGYHVMPFVVNYSETRSKDFLHNMERLKERKVWPVFLNDADDLPEIPKEAIVIDAIFGIGLNRPPAEWVVQLIQHINSSQAFTLSVDIPSGMFVDRPFADYNGVIQANFVLSIQAPKLVFFLPETGRFVNQWQALDIGLDPAFLAEMPTDFEFITKYELLPAYRSRERFTHKGHYGHTLVIGGSLGKIGAVALASIAALKAGAGLVSSYVPKCGVVPLQSQLPEAMVLVDQGEAVVEQIQFDFQPTVIALGMGLGTDPKTKKTIGDFIEDTEIPLVLDADGVNTLAEKPELLLKLPAGSVLTPHIGELKRLLGDWDNDFEKCEKAKNFSLQHDVVLVMKDAYTICWYKGRGYINSTGNPGMATAGSGDVLAGIIAGFMSQGYDALTAALFGVYLHGSSGDIAVEGLGYQALLASDLVDNLGHAFLALFEVPQAPQSEGGGQNSQGKQA